MRLDPDLGRDAARLLAEAGEEELVRLFADGRSIHQREAAPLDVRYEVTMRATRQHGHLDPWLAQRRQVLAQLKFLAEIRAIENLDHGDRLLLRCCRSGGRSLRAARLAREAGFAEVSSVKDSFEGRPDADGLRTVDGWKNSGLPYTYEVRKELMYQWP